MGFRITLTETVSGDTVTLYAPAPDVPVGVTRPGVSHLTAGGGIVQYKIGASFFDAAITIPYMSNSTKATLEAFFRSHWGKSSITYTDERSTSFNPVRFLEDRLELTKAARNSWSCTIKMRFPSVLI